MSPAAFSVSIETGSTFFRFQLGLINRLIDRTMNVWRVFSMTQTTRVGLKPNVTEFSVSIGTEAKFQSQLKPKNPQENSPVPH